MMHECTSIIMNSFHLFLIFFMSMFMSSSILLIKGLLWRGVLKKQAKNENDQEKAVWSLSLSSLAIIIKRLYVITYMCQNFGVRGVREQILKHIHQPSYLLSSDFPNNLH